MKHTKQGFVSSQDGTLEWKPGPQGMTEYSLTIKHGGDETKLVSVLIVGECSIENIETVLDSKNDSIQEILGERARNLREDIIRMAKTQ